MKEVLHVCKEWEVREDRRAMDASGPEDWLTPQDMAAEVRLMDMERFTEGASKFAVKAARYWWV